jgi:hypothetical protein
MLSLYMQTFPAPAEEVLIYLFEAVLQEYVQFLYEYIFLFGAYCCNFFLQTTPEETNHNDYGRVNVQAKQNC